MVWLTLIKGLVALTNGIIGFMRDRNLMEAGKANEIKNNLNATLKKINIAIDARDNSKLDDDSLRDDKSNRDNRR